MSSSRLTSHKILANIILLYVFQIQIAISDPMLYFYKFHIYRCSNVYNFTDVFFLLILMKFLVGRWCFFFLPLWGLTPLKFHPGEIFHFLVLQSMLLIRFPWSGPLLVNHSNFPWVISISIWWSGPWWLNHSISFVSE